MPQNALIASLAALALSGPAFGAVSYLSQSRTVTAFAAGNPDQSQSFTAPDFLPFSATAQVTSANGSASATQSSSLNADGFTLSASCAGSGQNAFNVSGTSVFDVTFSLDTASSYTLTGFLNTSGGPGNVTLSRDGTAVYESFFDAIDNAGLLQAGTYRLQSQLAAVNRAGFDPPSSLSLTFAIIPAPGTIGAIGLASLTLSVRRRRLGT